MKLVELGFCTKAHGIKGGFSFTLYNLEESTLQNGVTIVLFPTSEKSDLPPVGKEFTISNISFGNKVIAYLEGISDRNQVDAMIPFSIKIDRSLFPELNDDEFYVDDMIGMEVFNHNSGEKVGIIKKFVDNGAQIVFSISTGGKILDLPFVEAFFPVVDMENGRVEINLPEVIDA